MSVFTALALWPKTAPSFLAVAPYPPAVAGCCGVIEPDLSAARDGYPQCLNMCECDPSCASKDCAARHRLHPAIRAPGDSAPPAVLARLKKYEWCTGFGSTRTNRLEPGRQAAGADGHPLNATGREQARAVGARLADEGWDVSWPPRWAAPRKARRSLPRPLGPAPARRYRNWWSADSGHWRGSAARSWMRTWCRS